VEDKFDKGCHKAAVVNLGRSDRGLQILAVTVYLLDLVDTGWRILSANKGSKLLILHSDSDKDWNSLDLDKGLSIRCDRGWGSRVDRDHIQFHLAKEEVRFLPADRVHCILQSLSILLLHG